MIKGIPQKLLAYERFLQEHAEWREKVLLVQIAVPSRTDVPEYQKLRSMVHEIVGRINGAFGTLTYVPIHHLDRQLNFHELCALYAVTGGWGLGGFWGRGLGFGGATFWGLWLGFGLCWVGF